MYSKTKAAQAIGRGFLYFIISVLALDVVLVPALAEDISLSSWRLWPDREAAWTNDVLYLPSEVKLDQMPVNPPTGGWQTLNEQQGIHVTLPSTVEEHFWGKFGTRPYAKNEVQKGAH